MSVYVHVPFKKRNGWFTLGFYDCERRRRREKVTTRTVSLNGRKKLNVYIYSREEEEEEAHSSRGKDEEEERTDGGRHQRLILPLLRSPSLHFPRLAAACIPGDINRDAPHFSLFLPPHRLSGWGRPGV